MQTKNKAPKNSMKDLGKISLNENIDVVAAGFFALTGIGVVLFVLYLSLSPFVFTKKKAPAKVAALAPTVEEALKIVDERAALTLSSPSGTLTKELEKTLLKVDVASDSATRSQPRTTQ